MNMKSMVFCLAAICGSGVTHAQEQRWMLEQDATVICMQDTLKLRYVLNDPPAGLEARISTSKQFRLVAGPFRSEETSTKYADGKEVVTKKMSLSISLLPLERGVLSLPRIETYTKTGGIGMVPASVEVVADCSKRRRNEDYETDFFNAEAFAPTAAQEQKSPVASSVCICDTPAANTPAARRESRDRLRRTDTLSSGPLPLRIGIFTQGQVPCLYHLVTDTAALRELQRREFPAQSLRPRPLYAASEEMHASREAALIDELTNIRRMLTLPGESANRVRNVYLTFYFRRMAERDAAIRIATEMGFRTPKAADFPAYDKKDGYQLWIAQEMKADQEALKLFAEKVCGRMFDEFGMDVDFSGITIQSNYTQSGRKR